MKKLIGIFVALIIALGMSGAAYALWSETLYIEGTVYTGNVDVEWSIWYTWDSEPEEKDVSYAEAVIRGDTLYVTIYNAYPSIEYWIGFDVHNVGTIPVHVYLGEPEQNVPGTLYIEYYGPIQLHDGETGYGEILVHLSNDADEGETYTFSVDLTAYQWNEDPYGYFPDGE